MEDFDFAVIGAGIAGASIAYELAPKGRVILLEREETPGYHSTGRSADFHTEAYGNATIRLLTVLSRPFFEAPPPGFADHALMRPSGSLFIAREDQQDTLLRTLSEVCAVSDGGGRHIRKGAVADALPLRACCTRSRCCARNALDSVSLIGRFTRRRRGAGVVRWNLE